MYLAVDIGGTKTLLAVFTKAGKLVESYKIPTVHDYNNFKAGLGFAVHNNLKKHKFDYACVAIPGRINRQKGVAEAFGNIEWTNIPIRSDLTKILKLPVLIENDAKLAGLSEARLVLDTYKKVLYITVSTGIGGGVIINGVIDPDLLDSEPGQMPLEYQGVMLPWEEFASGRAIVRRFGKKASEINDKETWKIISRDIASGLIDVIALIQPEVVIIGGGVGTHFHKYGDLLEKELARYKNPLIPIPPIIGAKNAEEAVIYGCYEYIKQYLERTDKKS